MYADSHAIIIEGGSPETRSEKAFAILKDHFSDDGMAAEKLDRGVFEDLIVLETEEAGKDITVSHIETLIELFKQKPFASTGKAGMIPCGECMNEHAQNKLLKLLEEPAPGDVILILAGNAQRLLPTVRSRCTRVWLGYEEPERGPLSEDIRAFIGILIYGKGALAEANKILASYEGSREDAEMFLRALQIFLRDLQVGRICPELLDSVGATGSALKNAAEKLKTKHANRMRSGVLLAEKAFEEIERGGRIKYALRDMALAMKMAGN